MADVAWGELLKVPCIIFVRALVKLFYESWEYFNSVQKPSPLLAYMELTFLTFLFLRCLLCFLSNMVKVTREIARGEICGQAFATISNNWHYRIECGRHTRRELCSLNIILRIHYNWPFCCTYMYMFVQQAAYKVTCCQSKAVWGWAENSVSSESKL